MEILFIQRSFMLMYKSQKKKKKLNLPYLPNLNWLVLWSSPGSLFYYYALNNVMKWKNNKFTKLFYSGSQEDIIRLKYFWKYMVNVMNRSRSDMLYMNARVSLWSARGWLQIRARVREDDHGPDGLRGKQIRRDRAPVLREQRHRVDLAQQHRHSCR